MLCIRMQLQLTHFVLRCLRCACLAEMWVARACEYSFICLFAARCAKRSVLRVLRR
jgi:hypothetical protein